MSLLERIQALHVADLSHFRPFVADGLRVGWVKHATASHLAAYEDVFSVRGDAVHLAEGPRGFDERSTAMETVCRSLVDEGRIGAWRREPFPVLRRWGDAPLFLVDRGAVGLFGIPSFGLHLNGYVRTADGLCVWVARRSMDVPFAPGQLDHLVAGGQPYGLTLRANLAKECAEEASIPPETAARAVSVGALRYQLETETGLKDDTIFLYDLELPPEFVPTNADGEVESFELWPVDRLIARVRDTDDFKFNVGPVIVHFLVRHGCVGPEHPEYLDLLGALASGTGSA